jgi:hypothetical protein
MQVKLKKNENFIENIHEEVIHEQFEVNESLKSVRKVEVNQEKINLQEKVIEEELEEEKAKNDEEIDLEIEIENEIKLFEKLIFDLEKKDEEFNATLRSEMTT